MNIWTIDKWENIITHKLSNKSVDNLLLKGNYLSLLTSCISIMYILNDASISMRCKDPIARANQRSQR